MNEKLRELMKLYLEKFGDSFPTAPLAWNRTEAELMEIVQHCLKEGKDVYELGYLSDDIDIDY